MRVAGIEGDTSQSYLFGPAHKRETKNDPLHLSKKATTQHGSYREIPNKLQMQ